MRLAGLIAGKAGSHRRELVLPAMRPVQAITGSEQFQWILGDQPHFIDGALALGVIAPVGRVTQA